MRLITCLVMALPQVVSRVIITWLLPLQNVICQRSLVDSLVSQDHQMPRPKGNQLVPIHMTVAIILRAELPIMVR